MQDDAQELKRLLASRPGCAIAVAESLTSGRLQALIGGVSGASAYFRGGVTAYTLEMKVALLGVDREEAARCDCVSETVAGQMAQGVALKFDADLALATTGYAEGAPGGVAPWAWWALAVRGPEGVRVERTGRVECPERSRTEVQARVAEAALAALVAYLDGEYRPA